MLEELYPDKMNTNKENIFVHFYFLCDTLFSYRVGSKMLNGFCVLQKDSWQNE